MRGPDGRPRRLASAGGAVRAAARGVLTWALFTAGFVMIAGGLGARLLVWTVIEEVERWRSNE